jgi:hypothetical protein
MATLTNRDTVKIWSWVDAPRRYRSKYLTRSGPGNFRRALSVREQIIAVAIGQEILRLRAVHKMSQLALAARLCISQPLVSYFERGLRPMSHSMLFDLADVFSLTAEHFVKIATRAVKEKR